MLHELFAIIKDRQAHPREGSYTARLLAGGEDLILKKVADLFYHTLVLLAYCGLSLDDVEAGLRRRHVQRHTP